MSGLNLDDDLEKNTEILKRINISKILVWTDLFELASVNYHNKINWNSAPTLALILCLHSNSYIS